MRNIPLEYKNLNIEDYPEAGDWRAVFEQIRRSAPQLPALPDLPSEPQFNGSCKSGTCRGRFRRMTAKPFFDSFITYDLPSSGDYLVGSINKKLDQVEHSKRMVFTCRVCNSWISLHVYRIPCLGHVLNNQVHAACWF